MHMKIYRTFLMGFVALFALVAAVFAGGGHYVFAINRGLADNTLRDEVARWRLGGGALERRQNTVVVHQDDVSDDEGPWDVYDETLLRGILTLLREEGVRDVYNMEDGEGVNAMMKVYQNTMEGNNVQLWAIVEDDVFGEAWQRDFMRMVRGHLNIADDAEVTPWAPFNRAMSTLANYINEHLGGGDDSDSE